MSNISRGVICHHYFQIMTISIFAGFQIQMIPSRWYIDDKKNKGMLEETCCFVNKEAMQNFSDMTFVSDPLTVSTTVTLNLHYTVKKKVKYGKVWELAQQATQLAVKYNSYGKMVEWLKQFINRQREIINTHTRSVRNQNILEHTEIQVDDDKENVSERIKNPLVSRRKGRPETKRYKSSTEKQLRAKYTCKTCSQTGYNNARCRNR
jgi:hypothetical protein